MRPWNSTARNQASNGNITTEPDCCYLADDQDLVEVCKKLLEPELSVVAIVNDDQS